MCCNESSKQDCCQKPEHLKSAEPEECSPERILECHGEVREHPCAPEETPKKGDV